MALKGAMPRKAYGFWKRPDTLAILQAVNEGKMSREDAAGRLGCPLDDIDWYTRELKRSQGDTVIRKVTTLGNSIGVTLPTDIAHAYGIVRGALVQVEPTDRGLLVKPVKLVSALSPKGSALIREIVRRYRPALDAMARGERKVVNR